MANQWFRMYSDFLNDPKMISLAFEDQRHFIGILALKSDGTLDQECDEKLRDRIISQRLWIDYAILSDVKKRLVNAGLISDSWQPLAWDKRQFKSDKDSTAAARQQRYRESQARNALRNGTVTRLDTDTDTEQKQTKTKDLARGSRLPADWTLPKEWGEWALSERPELNREDIRKIADQFRDYWISVPGQRGVKLDWLATWRNRVRDVKVNASQSKEKFDPLAYVNKHRPKGGGNGIVIDHETR